MYVFLGGSGVSVSKSPSINERDRGKSEFGKKSPQGYSYFIWSLSRETTPPQITIPASHPAWRCKTAFEYYRQAHVDRYHFKLHVMEGGLSGERGGPKPRIIVILMQMHATSARTLGPFNPEKSQTLVLWTCRFMVDTTNLQGVWVLDPNALKPSMWLVSNPHDEAGCDYLFSKSFSPPIRLPRVER